MSRPHTLRTKPAVTADEIRPELIRISRRRMLARGLSLGSLALLTGCDLSTHSGVDAALWAMLHFNDRVQAALFSRTRLAQTYPASTVTKPFRFNAYYEEWQVREVLSAFGASGASSRLMLTRGCIRRRKSSPATPRH